NGSDHPAAASNPPLVETLLGGSVCIALFCASLVDVGQALQAEAMWNFVPPLRPPTTDWLPSPSRRDFA
ncbi:hypothetical protein LOC71_18820, partial [Rhodopirellula sp. JC740]